MIYKIILNKLDIEYFNNISSVKTNDFNLVQYGRNLKNLIIFLKTFK